MAIALAAWALCRCLSEQRRLSALLSYRNRLVVAEIGRVQTAIHRSPPRTIADVATIVGKGPSYCDDRNEPGPLDDPRAERCPRGSACHEAFYMADWYLRRHIEPPDTRVWFDREFEGDGEWGTMRVRVAGCEPGDLVLEIDDLEPDRFSLASW